MRFSEVLIEENLDIWQSWLEHPFLKGLAQGRLPLKTYHRYLIEDTIYLKEYARAFGLGIYHCQSLEDMRYFRTLLSVVDTSEAYTRIRHLHAFGDDPREIEKRSGSKANQAYVAYLLEIAKRGATTEMMCAVLPCMTSYAYIAATLHQRYLQVSRHPFYEEWLNDYDQPAYRALCKSRMQNLERRTEGLSKDQLSRLKTIFRDCSRFETAFWDMCLTEGEKTNV